MVTLRNNKGLVLIFFYLVLALLVTMGIGFITLGIFEAKFTERYRNSKIAFYLAEAACDVAIASLRLDATYTGVGYTALGEGGYTIDVITPDANSTWRKIVATGYYPDNNSSSYGYARRQLEMYAEVTFPNCGSRWAMFGKTELDVNGTLYMDSYNSEEGSYGGSNVGSNGDIGTNSTEDAALKLNITGTTAQVYGTLYAGYGGDPETVISINGSITPSPPSKDSLDASITLNSIVVPSGASNQGSLSLKSGDTAIFTAGDYYFTGISAQTSVGGKKPPPTIQVSGEGNVTFYVDGNFDVKGLYVNTSGQDPTQLNIKIIGDRTVNIDLDSTFYGIVYAPDSEITLKQCTFYGAAVADIVKVNSSVTIHYDECLGLGGDNLSMTPSVTILSWREQNQ
ncbi:MAG: hypothetical protein V1893_02170 [Candidatus Omnitrophota bacterium]